MYQGYYNILKCVKTFLLLTQLFILLLLVSFALYKMCYFVNLTSCLRTVQSSGKCNTDPEFPRGRSTSPKMKEGALTCYYRPQRSWGKAIFSQASVILLTGGECLTRQIPPSRYTPWQVHPPAGTPWD